MGGITKVYTKYHRIIRTIYNIDVYELQMQNFPIQFGIHQPKEFCLPTILLNNVILDMFVLEVYCPTAKVKEGDEPTQLPIATLQELELLLHMIQLSEQKAMNDYG